MAAVMSAPKLPDRSGRPLPPPVNSLPSRTRGASQRAHSANANRPLPPPPGSDSAQGHSVPNHGVGRTPSMSNTHTNRHETVDNSYPKTLPRGFTTGHHAPGHTQAPPPLPPRRTETMKPLHHGTANSKVVKQVSGYEHRFPFHKQEEFPVPDDFSGKPKKYTSVNPQPNGGKQKRPSS